MTELVRLYGQIAILRKGPQDVPAVGLLLLLTGIAYFAVNHGLGFSLGIAALFVVWATAGLADGQIDLADVAMALGCGVVVFGVGAVAFAVGVLGGGDVKLLAAGAIWSVARGPKSWNQESAAKRSRSPT